MRGFNLLLGIALMGVALAHPVSANTQVPFVERVQTREVHLAPRSKVSASRVLPAREISLSQGVDAMTAYTIAREIPHILDGLYSYCHSGRSLLSCFESQEALRSPYSRAVAQLAFVLHRQGLDLSEIRKYLKSGVPIHEQARSR